MMKIYKIFIYGVLGMTAVPLQAQHFLYPVAAYTDNHGSTKLYLIYQKSLTHLELWLWDPQTKFAVKALLSSFTPAGLTMLPNNVGFSFIDDGRIRVKKYSKRLPKAFDIREPLYEIGIMRWIDEYCGYFSAKERGHYGIYQLTLHDDLDRIHFEHDADCMYPYKYGDCLFYIERRSSNNSGQHYSIVSIDYPAIAHLHEASFNTTLDCNERIADILREETFNDVPSSCALAETKKLVCDFDNLPIAFLTMISDHEGYVIEHPATVDKQDKVITFKCHWLKKENDLDEWQRILLFQFSVPSFLLISNNDSCLYESLLPLLPRYYDGALYFVNSPNNDSLALFRYDLYSGTDQRISKEFPSATLAFSPIAWKKQFFYGGALHSESENSDAGTLPSMMICEDGNVFIDLPSFSSNS